MCWMSGSKKSAAGPRSGIICRCRQVTVKLRNLASQPVPRCLFLALAWLASYLIYYWPWSVLTALRLPVQPPSCRWGSSPIDSTDPLPSLSLVLRPCWPVRRSLSAVQEVAFGSPDRCHRSVRLDPGPAAGSGLPIGANDLFGYITRASSWHFTASIR